MKIEINNLQELDKFINDNTHLFTEGDNPYCNRVLELDQPEFEFLQEWETEAEYGDGISVTTNIEILDKRPWLVRAGHMIIFNG